MHAIKDLVEVSLKDVRSGIMARLRKLRNRHYRLAKHLYIENLKGTDARYKGSPLLVHQMGKVGSSSVAHSLRLADVARPIYHTHFLTWPLIEKYEWRRKAHLGTDLEGLLHRIWQYEYLRRRIDRGIDPSCPWKIVTLVRDPVARNLSNFFEHFHISVGEGTEQSLTSIEYDLTIPFGDDLVDVMIARFFEMHDILLGDKFLQREIQGIFGIDIFATPFPHEQGYRIYQGKGADLLLIKMERLGGCFSEAIAQFLGVSNVRLISRNVANEKPYSEIYERTKKQIRFPAAYLDEAYESRMARQFYSDAEIKAFRSKWERSA
jgi:hypothetical protein